MEVLNRMREYFADQVGDQRVSLKAAPIEGPVIDRALRLVKGLVTTTMPDMDDEVVMPSFDQSYFPKAVKSVYLDHVYSVPGKVAAVGACRNLGIRKNGAFAVTYVSEGALGDDIMTAIDAEALSGMSIGFMPLEEGPPDKMEREEYGEKCVNVVRHSKLLEYSFTSMPANPGALIKLDDLTKTGAIHRKSAVRMGLPTTEERRFHRAQPIEPGRQIVLGKGVAWVKGTTHG